MERMQGKSRVKAGGAGEGDEEREGVRVCKHSGRDRGSEGAGLK